MWTFAFYMLYLGFEHATFRHSGLSRDHDSTIPVPLMNLGFHVGKPRVQVDTRDLSTPYFPLYLVAEEKHEYRRRAAN